MKNWEPWCLLFTAVTSAALSVSVFLAESHEQGAHDAHDVSECLRIVLAQPRAEPCSPGENSGNVFVRKFLHSPEVVMPVLNKW